MTNHYLGTVEGQPTQGRQRLIGSSICGRTLKIPAPNDILMQHVLKVVYREYTS